MLFTVLINDFYRTVAQLSTLYGTVNNSAFGLSIMVVGADDSSPQADSRPKLFGLL